MAASRPRGWLADRLRPLGWSVRELSVMLEEHYKQTMRWNSGKYEPPKQVMDWLERFERFFAANPPPKRSEYAAVRLPAGTDQPPPFVQRVIDAMQPGETVSVDDLTVRIGARRKSVQNRLSAASVAGRLGPLRRVPEGVYRAVKDEVPPGGSLVFPELEDKGPTAFVSRVMDVVPAGDTMSVADVARRLGVQADVVRRNLQKAAEGDRLGPIEQVGEDTIRRVEDEEEAAPAPTPAPAPAEVVLRAPEPPKPSTAVPMTTDRARECLAELGWSQRSIARLLQWPEVREPRRWFVGAEVMPPEVAAWLEGVVAAKRAAIKNAAPGVALEPIISAAVSSATGDPTKVRDAALAARRSQPRPERMLPAMDAANIQVIANPAPVVSDKGLAMIEQAAVRALRETWVPRKALPFVDAVLETLTSRSLAEAGIHASIEGKFYRLTEAGIAARREITAARISRAERMNSREHDLAARSPGWVPGVSMRACERAFYRTMTSYTRSSPHLADNQAVTTIVRQALQNTHVEGMPIRAWVDATLRTLARIPADRLEAATTGKPAPARPSAPPFRSGHAPADAVPGVGAARFDAAHQSLLRWIAGDLQVSEIPANDPAHEDARLALRKAYVPGISQKPWIEAAVVELEKMGYELADEDDPLDADEADGAARGEMVEG